MEILIIKSYTIRNCKANTLNILNFIVNKIYQKVNFVRRVDPPLVTMDQQGNLQRNQQNIRAAVVIATATTILVYKAVINVKRKPK